MELDVTGNVANIDVTPQEALALIIDLSKALHSKERLHGLGAHFTDSHAVIATVDGSPARPSKMHFRISE